MKAKAKQNKHRWLIRIVVVTAILYIGVTMIRLHTQIEQKENQVAELNAQIEKQALLNEDMNEKAQHPELLQEEKARDNNMLLPGEQEYIITSKN